MTDSPPAPGHDQIVVTAPAARTVCNSREHARLGCGAAVGLAASLRNLALTILRLAGSASVAAALRYHARRPARPLRTIMRC